jgi:hypothetical protein
MSATDDLGTLRWFGDSWLAPVCDPRSHIPTPVGQHCLDCRVKIEQGDRGVTFPYSRTRSGHYPPDSPEDWLISNEPHHLACFLASMGIDSIVRHAQQRPLTRTVALDLRAEHWTVEQIAEEYGREPEEVVALLQA